MDNIADFPIVKRNPGLEADIGRLLLDVCRPDGSAAKLGNLLATIEAARLRMIAASDNRTPTHVAALAMAEFAKVVAAADEYRAATGLKP